MIGLFGSNDGPIPRRQPHGIFWRLAAETVVQQSLQVRIGIATGLVVVGDVIGHGAAQEQAVGGETPNLAARLQSFAGPNSILIGPTTRRILGNLFEYQDLGRIEVKGFDAPVQAYQVLRPSSVVSRFEALRTTTTPLVGREEEIELLVRRWNRAKQGEGSLVLVCGEPGIGKSRLTQAVHDRLATEPHTRLRYFASPHHQDSALYPIISQLERAARLRRDDTDEQRLTKLETVLAEGTKDLRDAVPLLADLLSIPAGERYSPLNLTPQKRKERTLNALLAQVEGLAAKQPVLMVFEDAHWIDPTSREALDLITDRVAALKVLVIVTFRPEFSAPWVGRPQVTILTLNRLPARQRFDVIKGVIGGKALPEEIADQIVERTDGIPLFIEELTKAVIEGGVVAEAGDHYEVTGPSTPLAIPTSLHASLLARLDRLAPVSDVAQTAAALGRSFSHELISAVAGMPGQKLDDALDQLIAAELIFRRGSPPDAEYTFKHALVQDTAYGTLLKSRRQQIHGRIAAILEFSEIVATQPALLAHHFTEAGVIEKAVGYWLQAGRHAISRSAMAEAVAQLRKGLELLGTVSDTAERQQRELAFQTELGRALTATRGYAAPETGRAYERARALSMRLGDIASLVRAGYGQFLYLLIRGEVRQATDVAHDILVAAKETQNEDIKILGHRLLGVSLFENGQLENARKNNPATAPARVMIPTWLVNIIMYQGYADQAGHACRLSLAEARASSMMHSRMFAECFAVNLLVMRRDYQQALASADAVCTMATDLNFPFFWLVVYCFAEFPRRTSET
jgi:predicted ATPase